MGNRPVCPSSTAERATDQVPVVDEGPLTIGQLPLPPSSWSFPDELPSECMGHLWAVYISGVPLTKDHLECDSLQATRFVVVQERHVCKYIESIKHLVPRELLYIAELCDVIAYGYAYRDSMSPKDLAPRMWYTPKGSSGGQRIDTSICAPADIEQAHVFQDQIFKAYEEHAHEFAYHVYPNEFSIDGVVNCVLAIEGGHVSADKKSLEYKPKALVLEEYMWWANWNIEY